MSIIIPANSAVSGGFDVANSCMFNSADSASFSKTPSGAGSNTVWTVSMWVKRASLAAGKIHAAGTSGTYEFLFDDTNFGLTLYNGAATVFVTSRALRDVSAWYHIVLAYNTGASGTDKCKLFINGVQETSFSTDNRSSAGTMNHINQAVVQYVGRTHGGGYFDGYMAEVCIIDGTQYAASDFGEFDEDSGIWKPIDVSGLTFGTNGFYLDFEDSANLGNDANGGTDLTENNIAATDQGTDTCTNNFATFNVLAPSASGSDIRQGNTRVFNDNNVNVFQTIPATMVITPTGKFYWEIFCSGVWGTSACEAHGITDLDTTLQTLTGQASANATTFAWQNNASFRSNGGTVGSTTWAVTYATNDILMFALDNANGALYAGKNGTWLNSGNPESGSSKTGALSVTAGLNYAPHSELKYGSDKPMYNFGSPYYAISSGNADGDGIGNFEYAVPSGYFALCTKNLAEYG